MTDKKPVFHITIAYVKKGKGKEYAEKLNTLKGKEITLDTLTFSDTDRNHVYFPLNKEAHQFSEVDHDLVHKAKQHFGETKNIREAGYLLHDGKMLDLTGRHQMSHEYKRNASNEHVLKKPGRDYMAGTRNTDHRELHGEEDSLVSKGGTEGMHEFMKKTGAIRLHPEAELGAHIHGEHHPKQIEHLIKHARAHGHDLHLDLDHNGNTHSNSFKRPNVEAVHKWIAEVKAGKHQSQHEEGKFSQEHLDNFKKEMHSKHPGLKSLWLNHKPQDNRIHLDDLQVHKEHRKQGIGSSVLNSLTELADKHNHRISLTTATKDDHNGTTSASRLKKFYGRFGFKKNKDLSVTANMMREPNSHHEEESDGGIPFNGSTFQLAEKEYPLAHKDTWYSHSDYEKTGAQLVHMHPQEYLKKVRPLDIDESSRDNIDDLKRHIQSGKKLDPLSIYHNGKEDGRHRAHAAHELGIKSVPVLLHKHPDSQHAEIVQDGIYKFPIHKNISHSTAEQIRSNAPSQELRGLRDHEGNHYVWDAAKGVHDTVANHLGLGKDWLKDNSQHLHAKDEAGLKKKWKQFAIKSSQHEEEQFAEDESHHVLYHGSPTERKHLKAGSMMTTDKTWASGYATRFDWNTNKEHFTGHTHEVHIQPKKPLKTQGGLHKTEERLINLAKSLGHNGNGGLEAAAKHVHAKTGHDYMVAHDEHGKVNGAISLIDHTPVHALHDPRQAVKDAHSKGEHVPENLLKATQHEEQIRSNAPSQELRGLRDHEGNHYVWDAAKGVHDTVANHLGLGKDWLKDNSQHLHAKDEAGLKKKWKQFAIKSSQHEEEQFAEVEFTGSQWTKKRPIKVLKNPSKDTLAHFAKNREAVRGLHNLSTGDHHYWDADDAVHSEMVQGSLNLEGTRHHRTHFHWHELDQHHAELARKKGGKTDPWFQTQHEEQFAEDEDSVEVDAYHASHKQIHGLEENHTAAKGKGAFGPGIYFSPHADVAKAWANKSPNGIVHLHKAKLKFNHPLDLTKPLSKKSTEKLSKHLGREIHPESSVAFSLERRHGSVTEGAKAAGFDGVIHWIDRKHGPEKNYIVTHPHHIVSLEHSEHSSQHEEQFAENDLLANFLSQSLANQIQSTQQEIISLKWKATEMRLPELAQVVQQELRKLDQHLNQGLIHVGYQGAIEGIAEVSQQYENLPTEQKVQKPTSNSITPTPSIEGDTPTPPKPPKSPLEALGEPIPPEVRLPDLERAIMQLMRPTAMVGTDWKETAELVKAGAFAITGDIAQHQSTEVQLALAEAMSEGHSASEFIETVQEKIFEGRGPLSDSHLENIFRTNTLRQKSNAKERTLKSDLVSDAFPYRAYNATADARTRPHHKALEHLGIDNTNIYNADDPVFIRYRPSWWYSCRCNHYGVTVVQAANRGVKEAVEWVDRAKQTAEIEKGSFYQYLNTTKPLFFQMVPPVPFDDPSFNDAAPTTSQHSESEEHPTYGKIIEKEHWDDGTKVHWVSSPFKKLPGKVDLVNGSQIAKAKEHTIELNKLHSHQNRVTVQGLDKKPDNSHGLPLVVKSNNIHYIQDGNHRLAKQAFDKKTHAKVRFLNLDKET